MSYAQKTEVSAEKSRAEIERTLRRYGADGFMYGWQGDQALVAFRAYGRQVRLLVTMPARNERRFTHYKTGSMWRERSESSAREHHEQACRQKWRALALVIKAKLEAVSAGISTFEEEFLANIVLPDGQSVGQWLKPQLAVTYDRGGMPPLLPAPERKS